MSAYGAGPAQVTIRETDGRIALRVPYNNVRFLKHVTGDFDLGEVAA
jgi:hypothetical protein